MATAQFALAHVFAFERGARAWQQRRTIVVCAPLRVKDAALPAIDGDLTVTSVYGGVDFREANGAEIELAGAITLGSETLFEHVDFESRSNALISSAAEAR